MWTTAQLKKIEETSLCVTLWFVEHDGKINPLCVMRTHSVEVRCPDFDFDRYETTIGELVKNLSPFALLNSEWGYDDYCNLAVDVDAGVFMTILPLDERKKLLNSMYGVSNIVAEAIRAAIENREAKKMHDQFNMAIRSYRAGHYPWKSSNDESVVPKIKKVYFNKPATIVLWEDGTKTVVKCQPGERYDAEKGLAMAISKKALGNTSKWYNTLKKELENAPKPKKRSSVKKEATDEKA